MFTYKRERERERERKKEREREREGERKNTCSIILSSVILNVCFINFTCLLTLNFEIYLSIVFVLACISSYCHCNDGLREIKKGRIETNTCALFGHDVEFH